MLQFMGDNKRLLQFHEHKLSDLEAFKSDTHMFQKNASASLKRRHGNSVKKWEGFEQQQEDRKEEETEEEKRD